ncbi:hypothetical protein [Alienimonas californiensis]|uniref:Uncharacterized protein n=1 Tax=Alienimonas californiensis TaxID=2527989 RepID=A0A517PDE6_9PLAN|nr:hypothetical protein [Alienimonas californiensis]QDT17394.1 hypothetical protein CA12_35150 [Alienimonas californiensis]
MLRAPHDAAGALGDCPHCEKEIRIPGGAVVEPDDPLGFIPVGAPLDHDAVEAAIEQSAPARTVPGIAAPDVAAPAAGSPGGVVFESSDGAAAPVTFASADEDEGTPEAGAAPATITKPARGRRRRGKRGSPVLAGLVLLVLFGGIGGAGWVMYERLAGGGVESVAAEAVAADAAPPAYFLPPDPVSQQALRTVELGVPFVSPVLEVRLTGTSRRGGGGAGAPDPDAGGMADRRGMTDARPADNAPPADDIAAGEDEAAPAGPAAANVPAGAILVTVRPGDAGRLVRAPALRERPEVKAWLEANAKLYGDKQIAFTEARAAFFAAVAAGEDTSGFRDSVALNAATDVTGWSVEAVADSRVVPCCRETSSGDLYFCIPRTATAFTIRGRTIPGLGSEFPFTYGAPVDAPPGD